MDDGVYALRRKVIEIIYEANARLRAAGLQRLPRQEIRIVDGGCSHILGYAWMGGNIVHIPKATCSKRGLTKTVLHELLHSVFGLEHTESCRLMSKYHDHALTDEAAWELFLGHIHTQVH